MSQDPTKDQWAPLLTPFCEVLGVPFDLAYPELFRHGCYDPSGLQLRAWLGLPVSHFTKIFPGVPLSDMERATLKLRQVLTEKLPYIQVREFLAALRVMAQNHGVTFTSGYQLTTKDGWEWCVSNNHTVGWSTPPVKLFELLFNAADFDTVKGLLKISDLTPSTGDTFAHPVLFEAKNPVFAEIMTTLREAGIPFQFRLAAPTTPNKKNET